MTHEQACLRYTPVWDYGAGDRSRTYDLLITNELLYQLSYTGGIRGGESVGKSGQLLK